jgi:hypothetical protein
MICDKCKKDNKEIWEKDKTYLGIDEHHNPPRFMIESWEGDIFNLCRECHRNLHDEIIKIMLKYSNLLNKRNKSEYWIWLHTFSEERKNCMEDVISFTKKWIQNDN